MANVPMDRRKRRLLLRATTAVGSAGVVAAALPFVYSMSPSERARAAGAPIDIDVSKIDPGTMATYEWRSQPVWVLRRTPQMLKTLGAHDGRLADPNSELSQQPPSCKNPHRSIKPEILITLGVCTHLSCSPKLRTEVGAVAGVDADWPGGFFCPCHGSKFDLAARVFEGVPAPTNLVVPPHEYLSDSVLVVGRTKESA